MKKIISLILVCILTLSLVGCGEGSKYANELLEINKGIAAKESEGLDAINQFQSDMNDNENRNAYAEYLIDLKELYSVYLNLEVYDEINYEHGVLIYGVEELVKSYTNMISVLLDDSLDLSILDDTVKLSNAAISTENYTSLYLEPMESLIDKIQ